MKVNPGQQKEKGRMDLDGLVTTSLQPIMAKSNSFNDPLLEKSSLGIELSVPALENKPAVHQVIRPVGIVPMRKTKARWLALSMAALLMFGNNYSFDNPQALQRPLMDEVGLTSPQYNLLYSVFSFPNIFLTLAGGFMIDFLGVRVGIFIFCLSVTIAQTVVAIGGTYRMFWLMLLGRGFFGVASENLIISQSAIVSKWFKGAELSMAIGIIMTVPEIASALNSFFSPLIYEETGSLSYPLFLSVIICLFSLACALVLIALDKKADKQIEGKIQSLNYVKEYHLDDDEDGEEPEEEEKVSFKDLKHFTATFWILLMICMLNLGIYIPFLDDANDFFIMKFKFTSVSAGRLLMIPYLVSAFCSPFLGTFVDRIGKRRIFILITCFMFTLAQFLFGILPAGTEDKDEETGLITMNPNYWSIVPLVLLGLIICQTFLLGLSFCFYSCVVIPSVQYVVEQRVMGTAFGLMGMLESMALATFPLIAASIVSTSESEEVGYSSVGFFFCGIGCLSFLFGCSLFFFDKKGSIILDFVNPEDPTHEELQRLARYRRESDFDEDYEEGEGEGEDDDDGESSTDSDEEGELIESKGNEQEKSEEDKSPEKLRSSPSKSKRSDIKKSEKSDITINKSYVSSTHTDEEDDKKQLSASKNQPASQQLDMIIKPKPSISN